MSHTPTDLQIFNSLPASVIWEKCHYDSQVIFELLVFDQGHYTIVCRPLMTSYSKHPHLSTGI
jgi:hypothetical protein